MFKKILKKAKSEAPSQGVDELIQLFDEIDEKQRKISDEKERIREEWHNGARTTKHRFTI